ncbi:MAG: rhodanese-like domain-containing protein [Bacteroidales bacterium]|nr:rhodanese-like domain-containing protein [Bacteroidales bacterium]
MRYLTPAELKAMIDKGEPMQVIDTRDPIKFEECHIPGAINIPQIDLPEKADMISRQDPVILYCLYGVKSEAPFLYLREKLKIKNVWILEGGIYQWANDLDQSLPIF